MRAEFVTLADLAARGRLDGKRTLLLRAAGAAAGGAEHPVSVVYYRAGYSPQVPFHGLRLLFPRIPMTFPWPLHAMRVPRTAHYPHT